MDLEKFLGNETKFNILKYLLFKNEGVSARELESKLNHSFPAIKKQLDNLEQANIIFKNQKGNKWQVIINPEVKDIILGLFLYHIKSKISNIFRENSSFLIKCYLIDFFNNDFENKAGVDMVFIHKDIEDIFLQDIKKQISSLLDNFFLELKIVFISEDDYKKRIRVADKFIVKISKYPFLE